MFFARPERRLLALVLALGLVTACSDDSGEAQDAVASASPAPVRNMLLICIDTVRADIFRAIGLARKDALQSWSDKAVVFENAMAPAPWTVPSVGSVFSGLWPIEHGAGSLPGDTPSLVTDKPSRIHDGIPLLPNALRDAGFHTTVISASAWTYSIKNAIGMTHGFETAHRWAPTYETLGENLLPEMTKVWHDEFFTQVSDAPTMHFLHIMDAHNWHLVPEEELDAFIAGLSTDNIAMFLDVAPGPACEDRQSLICKRFLVYAAAVASVRDGIAEILDTLVAQAQLDDTVVVLFSDHGEEFHDHANEGNPDDPYRKKMDFGHGQSLYQEQLHVPLLIWHPGFDGRKILQTVSLIDIGPSAARWLGVPFLPAPWHGRFLDEYIDPTQAPEERVIFASGANNTQRQVSVRVGDRKSIWYIPTDRTDFFDLSIDPLELKPAELGNRALEFDGYFVDYTQYRPDREAVAGKLSPEEVKRLQSIGYLQGVDSDDGGQ